MKRVSLIYFFTLLLSIVSVNAFAETNFEENPENIYIEPSTVTDEEMIYYMSNEFVSQTETATARTMIFTGEIGNMQFNDSSEEEPSFGGSATTETFKVNRMMMPKPVEENIVTIEEKTEVVPIESKFYIKAPNTGRK